MNEIKIVKIDLPESNKNICFNDFLDDGWKVCNGREGTIDLSDRFIVNESSKNIIVYTQKV